MSQEQKELYYLIQHDHSTHSTEVLLFHICTVPSQKLSAADRKDPVYWINLHLKMSKQLGSKFKQFP